MPHGLRMISSTVLSQILVKNRSLVESKKIFPREVSIGNFPRHMLVGVRGSGKSYLLYQKIQELLATGKSWDDMLYLNFEDERLLGFDVTDFNQILTVHAQLTGKKTLEREINAFKNLTHELNIKRRLIITLDEEKVIETEEGPVEVVPAWKWLQRSLNNH